MNINPTQQNFSNKQQTAFGSKIVLTEEAARNITSQKTANKIIAIIDNAAKDGRDYTINIQHNHHNAFKIEGNISTVTPGYSYVLPGSLSCYLNDFAGQIKSIYKRALVNITKHEENQASQKILEPVVIKKPEKTAKAVEETPGEFIKITHNED